VAWLNTRLSRRASPRPYRWCRLANGLMADRQPTHSSAHSEPSPLEAENDPDAIRAGLRELADALEGAAVSAQVAAAAHPARRATAP